MAVEVSASAESKMFNAAGGSVREVSDGNNRDGYSAITRSGHILALVSDEYR